VKEGKMSPGIQPSKLKTLLEEEFNPDAGNNRK
jgi:hypothetical protein